MLELKLNQKGQQVNNGCVLPLWIGLANSKYPKKSDQIILTHLRLQDVAIILIK